MQPNSSVRKRGFTLIELLTVVAIISLLIGLLVPAVNAARTHAKNVAVLNLVTTLGKGCEMFNQDFGSYPQSSGNNPFETGNVPLAGAQWLVLDLAGADLKGYVKQDKDRFYDSQPVGTPNGAIDYQDWRDWYSLTPSRDNFRRWGPYVSLDGKIAKSPERYAADAGIKLTPGIDPKNNAAGTSDWNNGKLPFIVDTFGFPVLYYVANAQARKPFSDLDTDLPGIYTQWDNTPFTGSENGSLDGLDLGGGTTHPLKTIGWTSVVPTERPHDNSFAEAVYDRGLFEQNMQPDGSGKVWPHRPDTFLIISAGKDGLYGTSDDVANFEGK